MLRKLSMRVQGEGSFGFDNTDQKAKGKDEIVGEWKRVH
jgi:hypothetical protein